MKRLQIYIEEDLVEALAAMALAINPMLVGRLELAPTQVKPLPKMHLVFRLSSSEELRYADVKTMGKLYLTRDLQAMRGYADLGPGALEASLDGWQRRLRPPSRPRPRSA